MNIENLILDHYQILLLIAGILISYLGFMPVLSEKYYKKNLATAWDKKAWPFSKEDKYIYGRYIRQVNMILIGCSLIVIAIYKFLYP